MGMRTNSSTSLATAALDDVATTSSSATVQHDNPDYMRTLRQYGRYFSTRLVQVVVQSRTNEKFNLECTLPSNNPDWFNLRIDELGEVSAQVKRNISSFPPIIKCMSIDFLLYTCDGEVLPMETWTFSIEEEDQQVRWANDIKSQLYLQLSVMLRSAMVAARMTPLHRYYVKKQSCDTFVILYKLGEGVSELDLGTEAKRLELGRFPTPAGAFKLEVAYRTQMERALSPREGHESPLQMSIIPAADNVAAVESPTPSSYCELMSEISASPSSVAATTPPDLPHRGLTPGRSRSTSFASYGENVSGSPKPKPHLIVAKNMPFANLLTVSYTGVLFPLPEETVARKKTSSESAIADSNKNIPTRSGSFSQLLACPTTTITTAAAEGKENREDLCSHIVTRTCERMEETDNTESENAVVRVNFELDCSERTIVNQDSDIEVGSCSTGVKGTEDQHSSVATIKHSEGDSDEVIGTSDDDSFVKIPLFGRTSVGEMTQEGELDVHLTEFMSSCKAPPPLEVMSQERDALSDIPNLLEQFSQKQSMFDKFVAEMRSASNFLRLTSQFAGVKDRVKYIPRRSLLYVPASNQNMLEKIPRIKADCIVLELEDGVALSSKTLARRQAAEALDKLMGQKLLCFELGLRVNSVSSGLIEEDVKEICKAENLPQAFMVPKVDSPEDVAVIYDIFRTNYTPKRITDTNTRLIIWIESARALLDMPRILSSTLNLHKNSGFFKLDGVVFGSDDYCADIGATRSPESTEVLYARQRFVACCKAFQLQAIDSVFIDIKDLDGLKRQSIEGHNWGFTGKQSIHPTQ
ncbi:HpcH/HpaI aldolase/citrate lyase family protein, partial [Dictyocaulus viviparus]